MNKLLEVIKIKLLDSKSMEKYTGTYHKVYNDIYNITTKDIEIITKEVSMLF